jgi:hypothetical protein
MSQKKSNWPVKLALIALGSLGIAWSVRQYRRPVRSLPVWERVLARKHGSARARQMAKDIEQRCRALLRENPLPANKALRSHLTGNILPGLALYQVLLKEYSGDRQAALVEVDEVMRDWTMRKSRPLMAVVKLVPNPFEIFRFYFRKMESFYPVEGWDFQYIEDSPNRVAFNATRCFYLKTLTSYGAPELTPAFCKTDDIMAELFPPSVRFVRTKTLGRGDDVCDFQYCRIRERRPMISE